MAFIHFNIKRVAPIFMKRHNIEENAKLYISALVARERERERCKAIQYLSFLEIFEIKKYPTFGLF